MEYRKYKIVAKVIDNTKGQKTREVKKILGAAIQDKYWNRWTVCNKWFHQLVQTTSHVVIAEVFKKTGLRSLKHISTGYSFCQRTDKFNKLIGLQIAAQRASKILINTKDFNPFLVFCGVVLQHKMDKNKIQIKNMYLSEIHSNELHSGILITKLDCELFFGGSKTWAMGFCDSNNKNFQLHSLFNEKENAVEYAKMIQKEILLAEKEDPSVAWMWVENGNRIKTWTSSKEKRL